MLLSKCAKNCTLPAIVFDNHIIDFHGSLKSKRQFGIDDKSFIIIKFYIACYEIKNIN